MRCYIRSARIIRIGFRSQTKVLTLKCVFYFLLGTKMVVVFQSNSSNKSKNNKSNDNQIVEDLHAFTFLIHIKRG